jgi:ribosomal protein L31
LLFFTGILATASAAPVNYNDPAYWEGYFENLTGHEAACYTHEGDSNHGVDNGDGSVTLYPFNQAWPGDHWEGLVVKSGSVDNGYGPGNAAYLHPEAGVPYFGPLNAGGEQGEVSHWIACKGTTPDTPTTTSLPPATTSSTTTTTSTAAPTTTTTDPPVTTTLPPTTTTSTSAPPTTTILVADLTVNVGGSCLDGIFVSAENTGDLPIVLQSSILQIPNFADLDLMWSGPLQPGEKREARWLGVAHVSTGEEATAGGVGLLFAGDYILTVNTLDHGIHTDTLTLTLDDPECKDDPVPEPTTTTSTTTSTTEPPVEVCDENHPQWNADTQSCIPTGVPTGNGGLLPATGFDPLLFVLLGLGVLGTGAGAVIFLKEDQG